MSTKWLVDTLSRSLWHDVSNFSSCINGGDHLWSRISALYISKDSHLVLTDFGFAVPNHGDHMLYRTGPLCYGLYVVPFCVFIRCHFGIFQEFWQNLEDFKIF